MVAPEDNEPELESDENLQIPDALGEKIDLLWRREHALPRIIHDYGFDRDHSGEHILVQASYQLPLGLPGAHLPNGASNTLYRVSGEDITFLRTDVYEDWAYGTLGNHGWLLALEHTDGGVRWNLRDASGQRWWGYAVGVKDLSDVSPDGFSLPLLVAEYELSTVHPEHILRPLRICTENEFDDDALPKVEIPDKLSGHHLIDFIRILRELRDMVDPASSKDEMSRYVLGYTREALPILEDVAKKNGSTERQRLPKLYRQFKRYLEAYYE